MSLPQPKQLPSAITGLPAIDSLDYDDLRVRSDLQFDLHLRKAYQQRLSVLTAEHAAKRTEILLANRSRRRKGKAQRRLEQRGKTIHTESAVVGEMNDGAAEVTETHENVIDHSGEVPANTDAGKDLVDNHDGAKQMHSLNDFFMRPVTIYDATWNSATFYNVPLKVWDLWSLDPSVRAKLSNYAYFRGTMKIKISVSGTPFHYGKLLASYQPYAKYNDTLSAYDALLTSVVPGATDSVKECYNGYLSQAPGAERIDVKENEPLIITLPFISHKEMFRLYNDSPALIVNATSFNDFEEAGELRITTLNPFLVANDDYDTHVSLNVYAWVEDIQLGSVTGTNIDITAESKVVNNNPLYSGEGSLASRLYTSIAQGGTEYEKPGPITQIATTVSKVADVLSDIPWIGPFAKATSTISGQLGKVATWFGWSKPVILEKSAFVKNQPFANGAQFASCETAFRLTCDPKQELTVDQTIGGVNGPDDMAINAIAARESFLTTFEWTDAAIAMDTVLWTAMVNPMQFSIATLANGVEALFQPTALQFAVTPFTAWRGTLKYRFEIVVSKFHRGKLLFRFEPNAKQSALINSNETKLNQQNTVIVDIQETQDVCFSFDWAFPRAWADVDHTIADLNPNADVAHSTVGAAEIPGHARFSNGYVQVLPLNELVQPTSGSPVKINVYVSCDDLQVAYPTGVGLIGGREDLHRRFNYTESKEITHDTINKNDSNMEGIHDYHYGERILSFRALLKRYQTVSTIQATTPRDGAVLWNLTGNSIPWLASPILRGTVANEPIVPGNNRNNLLNYMRPAYIGMRGGFRYRVIPASGGAIGAAEFTRISNTARSPADLDYSNLGNSSATSPTGLAFNTAKNEGTVNFHPSSNGGVEFEIPFYSNSLFLFTNWDYGGNMATDVSLGYDYSTNSNWELRMAIDHSSIGQHPEKGETAFIIDAIPAEDFTFLRFQGAPPLCVS